MKIDYDGQAYEFDNEAVTLQHAMVIQLHTGMSIGEWENSLDVSEEKPPGPEWLKSVQSLYWAVLAQNDVVMPIGDADPKIGKFLKAYAAAQKAEQDAKAPEPEDPTPGSTSLAPSPEPPSPTPASAPLEVTAASPTVS